MKIFIRLRAVVEVIPMVAGADPVIISGGIVGLVVGISRRVVQLTGLGVLPSSLSVESSSGLAVKSLEHLQRSRRNMSVQNRTYQNCFSAYAVLAFHLIV